MDEKGKEVNAQASLFELLFLMFIAFVRTTQQISVGILVNVE